MIITSLLDTDIYKLRLSQFIWTHFRDVRVVWNLTNRSESIKLLDEINMDSLRYQLHSLCGMYFRSYELDWLQKQDFNIDFINALAEAGNTILPDFNLYKQDGDIKLEFIGPWWKTTLWEVPALAIISELRCLHYLRQKTGREKSLMYSRVHDNMNKWLEWMWENCIDFGDFGTRRRLSREWQDTAVQACMYKLKGNFLGTSNCDLAMKYDIPCLGTIAHEVPMVMAALSEPEHLIDSQYSYLPLWAEMWPQAKTLLPDTYGTIQFFKNAPRDIIKDFDAVRIDSMEPHVGIECVNQYWDPTKTKILSDGLTFDTIYDVASDFIINKEYTEPNVYNIKFMMGTNLSNPFEEYGIPHASTVIKISSANGRPALKLSDNYNKITGDKSLIDLYIKTFGTEGVAIREVNV